MTKKTGVKKKGSKSPTLAEQAINFALENYDLHVTAEGQAFAVPRNGVCLPTMLGENGGPLTADVRTRMFDQGTTISKATVSDALQIVHRKASQTDPVQLFIRCASSRERVVIDMAEPGTTRCIVVTKGGWSVKPAPPKGIYFRRSKTTRALPEPKASSGAGWEALSDLLGWEQDSREFLLMRGWTAAAPFVHIQRPALFPVGAPGSAKSARGLIIISVWDPRQALGSSFGKNLEDDRVKAHESFLVGYDNVSRVSEAQSDHIARMVTGDAPDKRQLYSDSEIHSMHYQRTGVFTAVHTPKGIKTDALERLIILMLNRIERYLSEDQIRAEFQRVLPMVLADALNDLVRVLSNLPALYEDEPASNVRMKDYWLVQKALGRKYAKAYKRHVREGMREVAINDPWIRSVVAWLRSIDGQKFRGTPEEGFGSYMDFLLANQEYTVSGGGDTDGLPRSHSALSRAMTENALPLRAAGVEFTKGRGNSGRNWEITCTESTR